MVNPLMLPNLQTQLAQPTTISHDTTTRQHTQAAAPQVLTKDEPRWWQTEDEDSNIALKPKIASRPVHNQRPLSQIPDKPLIDLVTNEWRTKQKHPDFYDKDYEEDEYGQCVMPDKSRTSRFSWIRVPRRNCRWVLLYICFIGTIVFTWIKFLEPVMTEEDLLDASMHRASMPGRGMGTNAKPDFTDMLQLAYLEKQYLPGATNSGKTRLVFVGDVHGCKKELLTLLSKVGYNDKTDHLVFAGDMIFKGPDSGGVIDFARSKQASCVRGNHEDRTILAYATLRSNMVPNKSGQEQAKQVGEPTMSDAEKALAYIDAKHVQLAKQLNEDQIRWLQKCPVILNVGYIKKKDYVVVHAGLAPGVKLEKQDPFHVMNMRTIDLGTRVPSEQRNGEPWEKVWNHYQNHLEPADIRKTVIYGHDSKRGLNIKAYSRGLDTGCVNGGQLTALVINDKGKEKRYAVPCRNYLASSEGPARPKPPTT